MTETTLPLDGDRVEPVDIQQEMQRSYIDYAMSVIVGRAPGSTPAARTASSRARREPPMRRSKVLREIPAAARAVSGTSATSDPHT